MKKFLLSIIVVVCCLPASADTTPATEIIGNKTFYKIGTLDELTWFANHVNDGNTTVNAILTADITMNEGVLDSSGELSIIHTSPFDVWTPIGEGADDKAYSGEFNGNGHTISGLYCNDTGKNNIGLFGKANNGAYIHDLGLKDSYFSGNSWVAGICGDFASGRIENCWNGATVIANPTVNGGSCAGGITASCWTAASIRGCYNIGKISVVSSNKSQCGGICGTVAKNTGVDCSVSYCVSLEGKCDSHKAYNLYNDDAVVENVVTRNGDAFKSGEVCYLLNSGVTDGSQKWYQTLEEDDYPVLDNSRGVVYHGYEGDVLKYSNTEIYVNATHREVCDATCNAVGYTRECWEDTKSGKIYAEEACINELNAGDVVLQKTGHKNKEHQARVEATCLTDGNIEYWYCLDCHTHYTDEACTTPTTEITIAALGHDFTHTPYTTSTCTSEGVVEHWHCGRCGHDFDTGDEMASEDHVISGSLTIPCKESDVILVGMDEGKIYDDCHTFTPPTEGEVETLIATVTFDGDAVKMKVENGEETAYSLNENKPLETFFAHTFKLEANQDPDHPTNYYSTFYTSEGAYKVLPATAKAYIGEVTKGEDFDVLNLTATAAGLIPSREAVILRATESDVLLMPSCRKDAASGDNMLQGSDEPMTLPQNSYALSYGPDGVCFYDFSGRELPANKAFLTLASYSNGLRFSFGDTTDIDTPVIDAPANAYNLQGQQVDETYQGIVIINGKKVLKR